MSQNTPSKLAYKKHVIVKSIASLLGLESEISMGVLFVNSVFPHANLAAHFTSHINFYHLIIKESLPSVTR